MRWENVPRLSETSQATKDYNAKDAGSTAEQPVCHDLIVRFREAALPGGGFLTSLGANGLAQCSEGRLGAFDGGGGRGGLPSYGADDWALAEIIAQRRRDDGFGGIETGATGEELSREARSSAPQGGKGLKDRRHDGQATSWWWCCNAQKSHLERRWFDVIGGRANAARQSQRIIANRRRDHCIHVPVCVAAPQENSTLAAI